MQDGDGGGDQFPLWLIPGVFLLLLVAMGIFGSILGLIVVPFQWAAAALGWSETDLGWIGLLLQNLRYVWINALLIAMCIVSYSLLFLMVLFAFRTTRRLTAKRLEYFSEQHPLAYAHLAGSVGNMEVNIGVWWACSVGVWPIALVAYAFGVRSATWIVAGSTIVVLGVFYVAMLVNGRHLGRWAFQNVRSFILPYIFLVTPVFVALSFVYVFQYRIVVEFYSFFGMNLVVFTVPGWFDVLGFAWQPVHLLWALAASLGTLLLVVWFLPILIKRDFMELGVITVALFSPWVSTQLLERSQTAQQHVAQLLAVVPMSVLTLVSAVVVGWIFGWIKGFLVATYRCPFCGNRSRPTIRFCQQCGATSGE